MVKGWGWTVIGVGVLVMMTGLGLWECERRPTLLISWDWWTGRFAWHAGEVRLPRGYRYTMDVGADSDAGHFTGPGGRVVVRHDIGGYAGAYATPRGSLMVDEWEVGGARVWLGTSESWVVVTFPDSGMANFYVERGDRAAIEVLEALARSFRPVGQVRRAWRGQYGL